MLDSLQMGAGVVEDRLARMLFALFDRQDQGFFTFKDFYDILTKRMKPNYKRIVLAERERFRLHGLDVKRPDRKKQIEVRKEIQYVDRVVEKVVEKEVIKREKGRTEYREINNMWQAQAPPQPVIQENVQYVERP